MEPARKQASYADLLEVPDSLIGEIVNGDLYTSPRPALPHALASTAIGQDLGPFSRRPGGPGGPGGWWILFEPELHLGPDVLVPDIAGWRQDRVPAVPNAAYFEVAPDWVCEVVSPRTGRLDRIEKMPVYAREAVQHLWLVDALAQTLEIYRLEGGRWVVQRALGGAATVRAEPFDQIEIDLARWWLD